MIVRREFLKHQYIKIYLSGAFYVKIATDFSFGEIFYGHPMVSWAYEQSA
ncbi:hypothetical protein PLUTE_a3412 [Pseudoalteromonas luteoviolacea DSM 6061]|nr:hypothetical protein [Pseudoalteromonas luteoviolacea DSM 6061]